MLTAVLQNDPLYRHHDIPSSSASEQPVYISSLNTVSSSAENLAPRKTNVTVNSAEVNSTLQQSANPTSAEKIRTARDCLVDIAALLRVKGVDKYNETLMALFKKWFLSGRFNSASLDYLKDFKFRDAPGSSKEGLNTLRSQIDNILASCEKEPDPLRGYDNYYGRLFDSFFSSEIIHHPSKEMLESATIIKYKIESNFALQHSKSEKIALCHTIKEGLLYDPPPWRENISEVNQFLSNSTPENFINMLYSQHELAHVLTIHLAVKYISLAPGFYPIKSKASPIYTYVIKPQRKNLLPGKERPVSNRVGILLMHQHRDNTFTTAGNGIRPLDAIKPLPTELTKHSKQALAYGSPLAVGMSGSANLLKTFFNQIAKNSRKFNIEQAKLLSAAELTYSGGHSINEAYTTFNLEENRNFQPLDYLSLLHQPVAGQAIDYAWEEVLKRAIEINTPAADASHS